jgi:hypothetical protein
MSVVEKVGSPLKPVLQAVRPRAAATKLGGFRAEQGFLNFLSVRVTGEARRKDELRAMRALLDDGGWHTAKEIARALQLDLREVRYLANHAHGTVISSVDGYKLTSKATPAEVETALARLRHQAQQMLERVHETEVARHV